MAGAPLVALKSVRMGFGGTPLFEGLDVAVSAGDRLGLIGRNGAGKSTLLRLLEGTVEMDEGERLVQPGVRIASLPQDPRLDGTMTALEWAMSGGGAEYRAKAALDQLDVPEDARIDSLSGGQARRVALARALAIEPDVLLLDEPTNHLDLASIEWLENELVRFRGGVVVISHDRAFLRNTTRGLLWLRRGRALRTEQGFAHFEKFAEDVEAAEEAEINRLHTQLAAEERYAQRGVTARRSRNQRRVEKLAALRAERVKVLSGRSKLSLETPGDSGSGRIVVEARNLHMAFGDTIIARGFSARILRGDRVGFVGPNGAGKTTLLRLLTGQQPPDSGHVQMGTRVEIAYFDQHRTALDPEATLWQTLAPHGGDNIVVQGRSKHVVGYLKDFLFRPEQAHSPVRTLSGGERNRLLLAKLFSEPSSLLVLDEPTNDLDMETLDLLEEVLADYEGTLLLVSHDRDFLDRLVTSVVAVEGQGDIQEYAGGYTDYVAQRRASREEPRSAKKAEHGRAGERPAPSAPPKAAKRLSYRENQELETLPARIADAERRLAALEALVNDPTSYARDASAWQEACAEQDVVRAELADYEERWLELEMKREELAGPA